MWLVVYRDLKELMLNIEDVWGDDLECLEREEKEGKTEILFARQYKAGESFCKGTHRLKESEMVEEDEL